MAKAGPGAIRTVVALVFAAGVALAANGGSTPAPAHAATSAGSRLYFTACHGSGIDERCTVDSGTEDLTDFRVDSSPVPIYRVSAAGNAPSTSADGTKVLIQGLRVYNHGKPYWPENLLDLGTGTETVVGRDDVGLGGLLSPDGNLVLTASNVSPLHTSFSIKDLRTGSTQVHRFREAILAAAWAPDSRHFWLAINGIANSASRGRYTNHIIESSLTGRVQKSYLVVPEPKYGLAVDHLALDGDGGFVFFGGTVTNAPDRPLLPAFYDFSPGKHRHLRKLTSAPQFGRPQPVVDPTTHGLFVVRGRQLCAITVRSGSSHCMTPTGISGSLAVVSIATPPAP